MTSDRVSDERLVEVVTTVSDEMLERAQEGVTALLKTWTIDKGILRAALTAALVPAEQEGGTCERCQGNGEIVTDWDRYLHGPLDENGNDAVAECPNCDGTGNEELNSICRAALSPPPGGDNRVVAWLHAPTKNVFTTEAHADLLPKWQKQFAADIPADEIAADFVALVPLSSLEAVERERDLYASGCEYLGSMFTSAKARAETAEASLAAAREGQKATNGLFQQIAARADAARPAQFHNTLEWISAAARSVEQQHD